MSGFRDQGSFVDLCGKWLAITILKAVGLQYHRADVFHASSHRITGNTRGTVVQADANAKAVENHLASFKLFQRCCWVARKRLGPFSFEQFSLHCNRPDNSVVDSLECRAER